MSFSKNMRLYVFCTLCVVFCSTVLGDKVKSEYDDLKSDDDAEMVEVRIDLAEIDLAEINVAELVAECQNEIIKFFNDEKTPSENFDDALKNYTADYFKEYSVDTNEIYAQEYFLEFLRNVSDEDFTQVDPPKRFCDNYYTTESEITMCYEALTVLLKPEGSSPQERDESLNTMTVVNALTHLFDNQINNREEYLYLLRNDNQNPSDDETGRMLRLTLNDNFIEFKVGVMLSYFTYVQQAAINIDQYPSVESYCIDAIQNYLENISYVY